MMGTDRIYQMGQRLLAASGGYDAEITLEWVRYGLARFAAGNVHQNIDMDGLYARVHLADDHRSVSLRMSGRSIEKMIDRVTLEAKNLSRIPAGVARPLPGPDAGYIPEGCIPGYSAALEEAADSWRMATAQTAVNTVEKSGGDAYGRAITGMIERAVLNSRGLFSYAPRTFCDLSVTAICNDGYGVAEAHGTSTGAIDSRATAEEAAERARASQSPASLPAGDYPVVLLPYAVADVVGFIGALGADADAIREGRSFVSGSMGETVLPESISIYDDGLDPRGRPLLFDGEGVRKKRVDIVRDGVAHGALHDQTSARIDETASTGHAAVGQPFNPDRGRQIAPQNLFLATGGASVDEMIRATDYGLLVTSFHYTRPLDPREVWMTGMTRNGTFLIRGGEIVNPVKNLRFTDSYLRALGTVTHVGGIAQRCSEGPGAVTVPAIRLESLRFTGVTDF